MIRHSSDQCEPVGGHRRRTRHWRHVLCMLLRPFHGDERCNMPILPRCIELSNVNCCIREVLGCCPLFLRSRLSLRSHLAMEDPPCSVESVQVCHCPLCHTS